MMELLYEVFDIDNNNVYATNMSKKTALILIDALYDTYYNDYEMKLGIRLTDDTKKRLAACE